MPLTDLCNRPAGRAPVHRSIPASRTPRGASMRVEARLTPSLQLQAGLPTPHRERSAKEERRTGAALRCAGVLGRAQRSKPNPLTPLSRPSLQAQTVRTDLAVLPSRSASRSARGAFHQHAPAPLAHRKRACRLLQPPRLSSTATDRPTTPRTEPGLRPCTVDAGGPCTSRCRAGQAVSEPGATSGLRPRQLLPRDRSLGSFAPTRSARAPPVADSRLRRPEKPNAGDEETRFPRIRRRPARKRRPRQGYGRGPSAKKAVAAHPRCLPSTGSPMGRPSNPQVVPSLWNTGWCLCYRR
jgi:hypothetical protein